MLIGQERIFFINDTKRELLAYEFRTGKLLYRVPLSKLGPGRDIFKLMRVGDDETIIQTGRWNGSRYEDNVTVTLIDGSTGDHIQDLNFTSYAAVCLSINPKSSSFKVACTLSKSTLPVAMIAEEYSRQSDGLFVKSAAEAILLPEGARDLTLHPFLRVGISSFHEGPDYVWKALTFAEASDPDVSSILKRTLHIYDVKGDADRYLYVVEMNDITLPPEPPNSLVPQPKRERFFTPWAPQVTYLVDGRQLVISYEVAARVFSF